MIIIENSIRDSVKLQRVLAIKKNTIYELLKCIFFTNAVLCISTMCIHMVKNNKKMLENSQKVLFSSYAQETHIRLTQEHEEKCSFLAFRSDSQTLVDTH